LHVGVGYKLKREPENKYHANAVSMQHDRDSDRKVGCLQRKYAVKIVHKILKDNPVSFNTA
jgi:hypothetical protein